MLNKKFLLIAFPVLSFLWFTGSIVVSGFFYPDYSHQKQFISELGATGSPHGNYVNYFGFIPTELFMLAFVYTCFLIIPKTKKSMTGLVFIAIYGFTLGIAAVFPCDFECKPNEPTLSHHIHMLSAFPGYICGILSIFIIASDSTTWLKSKTFKIISYFIGILCIYAFLNLSPSSNFSGAFQRGLELMLYSWFIYFSYNLSIVSFPSNKHNDGM